MRRARDLNRSLTGDAQESLERTSGTIADLAAGVSGRSAGP